MSILGRWLKSLIDKEYSQELSDYVYSTVASGMPISKANNKNFVKSGYLANATVFSIVNLVTRSARSVPLVVRKVKDTKAFTDYKAAMAVPGDEGILIAKMLKERTFEDVPLNNPVSELMRQPNAVQPYAKWLASTIGYNMVTGNSYNWMMKPDSGRNAGKPTQLWVLPSQYTEIVSGGDFNLIEGYKLISKDLSKVIPAEDIIHIASRFNPNFDGTVSHLYGVSPLQAAWVNLNSNNQAVTTSNSMFKNQGAAGMLMEQSQSAQEDENYINRLKAKIRSKYQGSERAGDIIVTSRDFKFQQLGLSPVDLAIVESYGMTQKDIANVYNCPIVLLNSTEASTYNNNKEARKALWTQCIIPELNDIKDFLNTELLPYYQEPT